ncbi:hypothetical protein FEM48_Zijuj11G0059600 [Ziziphus jujuba var. spinosa]|uniref:MSP domain-containing protein n=1 Tax=Ziziphus jujuba var. spinosa TaxID=714518 RepID=A0A978UH83_ZIZJJ|nr:hypothetical protein FEM48_Zijuj11G0059600 [Ziziphus jujuba var. spinosa]
MSTGDLLSIEPLELKFPWFGIFFFFKICFCFLCFCLVELKKQISCSLQLSNKTDNYVAFKVKTTNPKKYCVRPNTGIVLPRSTCDVIVTMQAQKDAPTDMQCKDKFLLQSVKANDGAIAKDINAEMFNKEAGHVVEECKLRVLYVSPPQPPSPVPEGSEEGSSPRGSISENGNVSGFEFANQASRALSDKLDFQDKSAEVKRKHVKNQKPKKKKKRKHDDTTPSFQPQVSALPLLLVHSSIPTSMAKALISKLTDEKNSALQQNNKLRQELELLRREGNKNRGGGVSFLFVIIVGLLGLILGYLMKRT